MTDPTTPDDASTPDADVPDGATGSGWQSWLKLALIIIVLPVVALSLLWHDRCKESPLSQILSADGSFSAITLVKDCGPSMAPATIVRVVERHDGRDGANEDVLLLHGKVPVGVAWETPAALEIAVPKDAVIVSRRAQWKDLTVRFK